MVPLTIELVSGSPPVAHPRAELAPSQGIPGETLVLSSRLKGFALFQSSRLVNHGDLLLCDRPSTIGGALTNLGAIEVRGTRADVAGPVTNEGILRVTNAEVRFSSTYTEHGGYLSDPSDNYFTDLIIGTSGYLVGGVGDRFLVSGDLVSASTSNTNWSTEQATLIFRTGADAQHSLSLTGNDYGSTASGFAENFAWGRLEIALDNAVTLVDGNATPGGALYAGEVVGAQLSGGTISNVFGAPGLTIYYDPALPANDYLGGAGYGLTDAGNLTPLGAASVPVLGPLARVVLAFALAGLTMPFALWRKRRGITVT